MHSHAQFLVLAWLVLVRVSFTKHIWPPKRDLQIARGLHGTIFTRIFKLFHARRTDRQRICHLELVVVHSKKSCSNCHICKIRHGVSFGVELKIVTLISPPLVCSLKVTSSARYCSSLQRCEPQSAQFHSRSHLVDPSQCPHLLGAASVDAIPMILILRFLL